MKPGLAVGTIGELRTAVAAHQVIHLGAESQTGAVVFSTPSMIDLMEHAAREALRPFLDPGEESVGATVQVEHLAATPIGAVVRAVARVTSVNRKLVDFEIQAFDAADQIGRGTHTRAVIQTDRFAGRLAEKSAKLPEGVILPMALNPNTGDLPRLETLSVDQSGSTVAVTLNRPQKLNAVNAQMTADWERVNDWLAGHPQIRVVIVTGAGEAFCAGDDVPEVGTLPIDVATQLSLRQARMYLSWEQLPQIFIAAVNGVALGAGCVMACACDFRIAAHSARFGMPEILLGWPPGYGIAQLTALVGKARALQLCLLGQQITSQTAAEFGLTLDVVPLGRVVTAARELGTRLLSLPANALRETKRLVHQDEGSQPKIAHLSDTASYIRCLQEPDAREGIAAFREKRPPKYEP
ncbi:MAG: enoyl-CoA hydratase/isomerase family protein [Planctomycetes bacterium]|nr:enoyl-CoA hydratase/isomerase family protein [Planctomycetota bacterium]